MAIVKAVSSRASIGRAIKYVTKDEKTEEKLVSGIECNPTTAIEEMKATKEIWGKTEGRQYKHFVHSFPPEEKITPEKAHELAKELCQERFKGHEVLIATHKDKDHIHSHIIVNSVNYEDGHKLQWSKKDLSQMKEHCNELSKQHGLSVPERGEEITTYSKEKYKALERAIAGEEDYKSYVLDCYKTVSAVKEQATDREDFIVKMKDQGYETSWSDSRKHITFTDQDGNKVRNSNLEKTFKEPFGKEDLEHGFERNLETARTISKAREQLRSDGAESLDRGTVGEDTKAIIDKFRTTSVQSDIAVRADESQRTDKIANEQSRQRELDRDREQKALERSTKSKGYER
ncbi:MAG: relaxase/mobilization nuclease domain-containing protein [Brevinema sp.]